MKHGTLVNSKHTHRLPNFYSHINNSIWLGAGFMTKIADLGFSKQAIVETVVSTYNVDGQPNAAPMGATMDSPQRIVLRIYTSSSTYKNLQTKRCGVVNVTSDPELFYRAPRLRMADAHVEVTVADITSLDAEKAEVTCKVKLVKASTVLPKVYCRASFATIEAIIHATRVKAFMIGGDRQKQEQALKLLETIRECRDVVNRVAPNSRYSEIMADLTQRVDSWRVKGESLR